MNDIKKDRKYFLIFCILSIVGIVIVFSISSIMRGTNASFGGITGELTVPYKVTYYANWPIDGLENDNTTYEVGGIYQILGNMYEVPSGYEFLGWGTEPNGMVVYNVGHVMSLTQNLNLYAVWGLVDTENDSSDEEVVIMYGDTNLDGIVNENDYLLIDNYLLDNSLLSGQGLVNADVNNDSKVDNIDSDIIKQACLGTSGYVGFLPEKPILIYELYINNESGSISTPSDDDTSSESDDGEIGSGDSSSDSGNNSSSGGSGNSGSGSGSTGSGGGNSNSGNSNDSNKPGGGSTNNSGKPSSSDGSKEEDEESDEEESPKVYEFKFMNGNDVYAITECEVLQDETCKLILPNTVPSKVGYVFNGWSLNEECNSKMIKDSMTVNGGATYYACYFKLFNEEKEKNNFNIWIMLFGIWCLASILIYRLIIKFKKREIN